MNPDGKVAIITGSGGKGTGRAVARRFAQEGMAVVVSDTNHTGGIFVCVGNGYCGRTPS
jgi:NAD(P)-dependent dehydrogenase (short-subunit alcohol dehydrogenase family)